MLREVFSNDEIIMMLGCENMSIGLYTEHIPLKFVPKAIDRDRLYKFLKTFQKEVEADKIAVLSRTKSTRWRWRSFRK